MSPTSQSDEEHPHNRRDITIEKELRWLINELHQQGLCPEEISACVSPTTGEVEELLSE